MARRGCDAVGIDLGTTFSSIAHLDAQLVPCVVPDTSGHAVVPSVVYFDGPTIIVGQTALEMAKEHPDRVVQFVKLRMGEDWAFAVDGTVHRPESLSGAILAHLAREAAPQIGPVRRAVVTVPAWFTETRRRATEQAGRIAGLDVIGTLNEPMAAALAYGLHRADDAGPAGRNVLVYDLGGGTFDVTVMRITPTELVELATRGNRNLGGKDWDEALMGLALADFDRGPGRLDPAAARAADAVRQVLAGTPDPPALAVAAAVCDLRAECERAKRRLSQAGRTGIPVRVRGYDHTAEVTREQFEAATAPLLQATRTTAETALEDAGLDWGRIDRVVLVGGSTHMPMVRDMLLRASGKPPDRGINPVTAVALGAATYAHLLEVGRGPRAVPAAPANDDPPPAPVGTPDRPAVRLVTAHGLGVRTNPGGTPVNTVLIPRNTAVPATARQRFRTRQRVAGPATGIRVVVTQGDTADAALAEVVGTARITGIPADDPPGQPVEITMAFDAQSRLHIHALYVNTGRQLALDLDVPTGLREAQVRHYREVLEESGLVRPPGSLDDDPFEFDDLDEEPLLEPLD